MKIYFTSLFLLFSLSSLSLKAINLADSSQVQQLSEVVVTAHRSEQSAFETPLLFTPSIKNNSKETHSSVPDALFGVMGRPCKNYPRRGFSFCAGTNGQSNLTAHMTVLTQQQYFSLWS
ncbi:MAG: hypothetical protein R2822_19790 [Spirosomataceae bacterium]